MNEYDVLIIGAGQAGIPLARKLAKEGKRVAIAERKHLGGSCVNFGCTPTKAAIASARIAHVARRAADYGIVLPPPQIDFRKVMLRVRAMVDEAKASLEKGLSECGAAVLRGEARLTGRSGEAFVVDVSGVASLATQVVINTGTRTHVPEIAGLAQIPYLHSGNWLASKTLPAHVLFAGAGYIALEMAQFYRRLGSKVTVVGPGRHVADHEDADVAEALQKILEAEGIAFHLDSKVKSVATVGGEQRIIVESKGNVATISGSHLFVATGRKPNIDDLGLETIGLKPNEHGCIDVDDRLATSVRGVWAAGDVRGGPMFTNASWDDHRILESQLIGDARRTKADRIVPYAIFTDPELGRVGMTELEAREQLGEYVQVATFEMKQNGKASEQSETLGFIKLIADVRDRRLLGAAILSVDGAEMAGSYITLMNAKATLDSICDGIYIHPTLVEAIQSAAMTLSQQIDSMQAKTQS